MRTPKQPGALRSRDEWRNWRPGGLRQFPGQRPDAESWGYRVSPAHLEFHPDAIAEARAAREWYAKHNPAAADAFMAELDRAVELILSAPQRWPLYLHGTRRYLLRRFPYSIVYREIYGVVRVVAVAHGRRRPEYWINRY